MAEFGSFSLLIALAASVYSGTVFITGAAKGWPILIKSSRYAVIAVFVFTTSSLLILFRALVTHNFQLEYVASYTSSDLSFPYFLSALWAGSSGSLLLWAWFLSLFALLVVLREKKNNHGLEAFAYGSIMLILAFFLGLLAFASSPFIKLAVIPAEGMGINPILENPVMIIHPPLLLSGYAGFTIPFTLTRLNIDPAHAGAVILTTITDVVGFMVFLGLGTIFLLP